MTTSLGAAPMTPAMQDALCELWQAIRMHREEPTLQTLTPLLSAAKTVETVLDAKVGK